MTVEIIFIVPYQPYLSTGLFIYSMGVLAYQRLNYDISKKGNIWWQEIYFIGVCIYVFVEEYYAARLHVAHE